MAALVPVIGYEAAANLAKEALATGRTIRELAIEKGLLSGDEPDKAPDPKTMIHPRSAK